MGHVGAIISGNKGDAKNKILALTRAGVRVTLHPGLIGETMYRYLQELNHIPLDGELPPSD